jgi:heme a synthase
MTSAPVLHRKRIAAWLLIVAAMIFIMVVLGGTTRLTRSGLSIVEWRLFEGTLPPLTEAHWQELFELYKKTPEYRKINTGMDLAGFEKIFWLEYLHRLWGRLIFFVALVPLLWLLWRHRIEKRLIPRTVAVPILVALNGILGWFMVASGLIDIPRVSPYRLTAHLGLAVAIYAYLLWVALDLLSVRTPGVAPPGLRRFGYIVVGLVFLMILSGGFVAGTKAGFAFNTFPWMNGGFFPEGLFAMQPFWINLFENIATVQFNHRLLAYLLCLVIPLFGWKMMRANLPDQARRAAPWLVGWLVAQVLLGIATLIHVTPVALAAVHQAGAMVLFSLAVYTAHALRGR